MAFRIQYRIPDEDKIEQTIIMLHQFVPGKEKKVDQSRVIPAPAAKCFS